MTRSLLPTPTRRAEWRAAGRKIGLDAKKSRAYAASWVDIWREVLEIASAQPEWDPRHLWLIADYVEARRLAHEHQLLADTEGRYATNQSGRTFAHPGIDKARDARKESREIASELGITPRALRDAGLDDDADAETAPTSDQAGL